jgi:hypothetical protein
MANMRIQTEFGMFNLNRISPTLPADLWQTKDPFSALHTWSECLFILNNWRKGKITRNMGMMVLHKQEVMAWMPWGEEIMGVIPD